MADLGVTVAYGMKSGVCRMLDIGARQDLARKKLVGAHVI